MSPSAFEAHCGASSSRKWRVSLRHASENCTIGQWLEERGLNEPVSRGEGRAPRPAKEPRAPQRSAHWLEQPRFNFALNPRPLPSASGQLPGWDGLRSAGTDETGSEGQELPGGLYDVQPSERLENQTPRSSDQPTEVRVTCRGTPGVLNLVTWKVHYFGSVCFRSN